MFVRHRTLLFNECVILLALATRDLSAQSTTSPNKNSSAGTVVPFVGCKADGQVGPRAAPKGRSKRVQISNEAAERLAYYKAEDGLAVLGPRGWYCFETYGSSGSSLYLSPESIDSSALFSDKWKGFNEWRSGQFTSTRLTAALSCERHR